VQTTDARSQPSEPSGPSRIDPPAPARTGSSGGARGTPSGFTVLPAERSAQFRRLMTRAFLVPASLLALLAVALGVGVTLLVHQARLTEASDHVLATTARLRELLVSAAQQAGFEPRVTLELNESQRIRRLVARRMGVAILPRSDAEAPGANIATAALIDPSLRRDITLAWREDRRHAPAAAEFLRLSRELFAPPQRGGRSASPATRRA